MVWTDAREIPLPDGSVQCVVTSPPYFGLRDYGTSPLVWGGDPSCDHAWGDEMVVRGPSQIQGSTSQRKGRSNVEEQRARDRSQGAWCQTCEAWRGHLGLEPTPSLYVQHIVEVFREVRRVLRDDGVLWLNIGDSYVGAGYSNHKNTGGAQRIDGGKQAHTLSSVTGLKNKDLIGIPWMLAFALRADGWYLRQDIIWHKPNAMPESVKDRCTKSHEYLFLLTKSERYYFDAGAIKEEASGRAMGNKSHKHQAAYEADTAVDPKQQQHRTKANWMRVADKPWEMRNRRSVWTIATQPYKGAHFAVFPETLVEPCVLAGSTIRACAACGTPYRATVTRREPVVNGHAATGNAEVRHDGGVRERAAGGGGNVLVSPACDCGAVGTCASMVFDPFAGSGTTMAVARRLGRRAAGCELNPAYHALIAERLARIEQNTTSAHTAPSTPAETGAPSPAASASPEDGADRVGAGEATASEPAAVDAMAWLEAFL